MARDDERPTSHTIEHARSNRSKCATCGVKIEKGELRLAEAYVTDGGQWAREHRNARNYRPSPLSGDRPHHYSSGPDVWERFHHLPCAAQAQPYKLRSALTRCTIELSDRDALEAAMASALAVVDSAEENEATRDEYLGFIDRLRDSNAEEADEHLLVFGDWLQSIGDPRGELIATQHGLETATGDAKLALVEREKKLLAVHSKYLRPEKFDGTLAWRRGFVRQVTLKAVGPTLARLFEHPSLRLVRELVVDVSSSWNNIVVAANLPHPLPPTLRSIELRSGGSMASLGAIAPVLANSLPQLERLVLDGPAEVSNLAHPTLAELVLVCADATAATIATREDARSLIDRVSDLAGKKLPNLTRLVLRIDRGLEATLVSLTTTNILESMTDIELHGDLTTAGLGPLRKHAKRLERLDVRRTRITQKHIDSVRPLAKTVVIDDPVVQAPPPAPAAPRDWLVRHTRKPEWGIGRVIEETESGLQVEFESGGTKLVRNVELLEDVSS